jgi:hypothetical protein
MKCGKEGKQKKKYKKWKTEVERCSEDMLTFISLYSPRSSMPRAILVESDSFKRYVFPTSSRQVTPS